ncbi:hypothetical protein G6F37_010343 [Rhizopus arrhizus]|nr:hypothetical protein G6F38_009467 [Rhizopus arrhizus]KAG1153456.1 hypothetical protein G6F37_010343 [Rhizopus arrhizus]
MPQLKTRTLRTTVLSWTALFSSGVSVNDTQEIPLFLISFSLFILYVPLPHTLLSSLVSRVRWHRTCHPRVTKVGGRFHCGYLSLADMVGETQGALVHFISDGLSEKKESMISTVATSSTGKCVFFCSQTDSTQRKNVDSQTAIERIRKRRENHNQIAGECVTVDDRTQRSSARTKTE